MNARLLRVTFAPASVLIANIVIGGMMVLLGKLLYRTLAEARSPGLGVAYVAIGGLLVTCAHGR